MYSVSRSLEYNRMGKAQSPSTRRERVNVRWNAGWLFGEVTRDGDDFNLAP